MNVRKKLVSLFASAALAFVGLFATAGSAQAATYFPDECNSSASDGQIDSYDWDRNIYHWYVNEGDCVDHVGIAEAWKIRVDTDPSGGYDMESYEIGHINFGYGSCHSGETNTSDPSDSYTDTGFRYHTVRGSNC